MPNSVSIGFYTSMEVFHEHGTFEGFISFSLLTTPLVFIMYFRVVYAFMAYISLTTDSFTGDGYELLFVASCHPRSSH